MKTLPGKFCLFYAPHQNCATKYYPATTYNQHTARTGDKGPHLIGNYETTCSSQTSTTTGKRTDTANRDWYQPSQQNSLLRL